MTFALLRRILKWTGITLAVLIAVLGLWTLNLIGLAERAVPDYAGDMAFVIDWLLLAVATVFLMIVIMIAVVGIISVAVTQGWINLDEDPVHLAVTAPEKVILPRRGEVPFSYTVNLKNNTDETVLLEASDPCRIHRWFVADSGGNFVQGEPEETCAQVVMIGELAHKRKDREIGKCRFRP